MKTSFFDYDLRGHDPIEEINWKERYWYFLKVAVVLVFFVSGLGYTFTHWPRHAKADTSSNVAICRQLNLYQNGSQFKGFCNTQI